MPAVEASNAIVSRPDLAQLISGYDTQERGVETEIRPQLLAARDQYKVDLDALTKKLDQAKRADEAKQVRLETERFNARGLDGEPAKTVPPAVRTPWATLLQATATADQSVASKRSSIRTKFEQGLVALERTYRNSKDADGVASVQRARAAVAIRRSIEANGTGVTQVVSKNPNWWQDMAREGGYVVGFEGGKGGWFQFTVLGSLKPIFMTMHGLRDGQARGTAKGERVLAKDGYAVGGLIVRFGDVVDVMKIIFMRINSDGLSLNPQDYYLSAWLGNEEDKNKAVEINPRGHLIVGLTGASGDVVESLGLVYLK